MGKRGVVLAVLGIVAIGLLGAVRVYSGSAAKDEMCVPMGKIELKAPDGAESKRAAVEFPHARHFDIACVTCHHTWDRSEPVAGCMTSGCHDLAELPKRSAGEKVDEDALMTYFKTAYHKQCIGCHKEMKAKAVAAEKSLQALKKPAAKTGPTTCAGCHPKES
jgi:hypothetical protein